MGMWRRIYNIFFCQWGTKRGSTFTQSQTKECSLWISRPGKMRHAVCMWVKEGAMCHLRRKFISLALTSRQFFSDSAWNLKESPVKKKKWIDRGRSNSCLRYFVEELNDFTDNWIINWGPQWVGKVIEDRRSGRVCFFFCRFQGYGF